MKKKRSKNKNYDEIDLLACGNVGLARLLVAVNAAGPQGISTNKLLEQLNSSNNQAQAFIKRAARKGLIERIEGKSEEEHNILQFYSSVHVNLAASMLTCRCHWELKCH